MSDDGNEVVLGYFQAGDFFGELSLLDGLPRSTSAQAIEDSETLVISRDDFCSFLRQHPDASIAMLACLSRRLRRTDDLVEDAAFLDVAGRLAKRLLELKETHGQPVRLRRTLIPFRLTHAELAAMVGATRESVTKSMQRFTRAGFVTIDTDVSGHRIIIRSPEQLRRQIGHD